MPILMASIWSVTIVFSIFVLCLYCFLCFVVVFSNLIVII